MSFSISPAVTFREIDLTTTAAEEISSLGAIAGKFVWGPVGEVTLVSNETDLAARFGKPNNDNFVDFFSAASFLAYTSGINVVRIGEDSMNATLPAGGLQIKNETELDNVTISGQSFIARYPGALGNSIAVSVCNSASEFRLDLTSIAATLAFNFGGATPVRSRTIAYTGTGEASAYFNDGPFGDFLVVDSVKYRVVATDNTANTVTLDRIYVGAGTPTTIERRWAYAEQFGTAPATDAFHLIITDATGQISGVPGSIIENPYSNLSTVAGTKDESGNIIYWIDVLNTQSAFLYAGDTPYDNVGTKVDYSLLEDGDDSLATIGDDDYIAGYGLFANADSVDAPLIIGAEAIKGPNPEDAVIANYLIQTIAEVRRDGVVFLSPSKGAVVNNKGHELTDVVSDRSLLGSTSYAVMDSGWKYMYDKYNDVFRWVPLNGDHAGLYARVDRERETWVSAAGTTKGRIKNVVKLAWTPDQTNRDSLYVNDVNPVTIMPVAGPVMFGDKTLLGKNSAFSRINVRRLFITMEKAIATAAAELLFEFNDEFTQRRFVSMVEPFLRSVKGRRGITDFRVIADATVNTPQVVQNNRFVGQIYVKPNYSVNFIRLDFVAVNASANFDEVVGSV